MRSWHGAHDQLLHAIVGKKAQRPVDTGLALRVGLVR
jgi:hypothetical protein